MPEAATVADLPAQFPSFFLLVPGFHCRKQHKAQGHKPSRPNETSLVGSDQTYFSFFSKRDAAMQAHGSTARLAHIDRHIRNQTFCAKIKVGRLPYLARRGPSPLVMHTCMSTLYTTTCAGFTSRSFTITPTRRRPSTHRVSTCCFIRYKNRRNCCFVVFFYIYSLRKWGENKAPQHSVLYVIEFSCRFSKGADYTRKPEHAAITVLILACRTKNLV